TGVSVGQDSIVKIYGSEGKIVVESPWFCHGSDAGESTIEVHKGGDVETITCSSDKGIYALEADVLANNIANRQAPSPAMSWGDSLGNASTLDQWIAAVGVDYPSNRQSAYTTTLSKEPLKVSDDAPMIYGELPGVNKKISRLVMGMDNQMTISHATAMFDDFFARGGNTFDTAFIYAGGLQERLFGQWVENRGNREDVILIDKGAHTPYCLPECIGEQLKISLERLGFDYTDIYFMHRDNLDVPIGEFVDALNDLKDQGLMNAFGGSNWSLPRIKEFNEYAAANGKTGFAAVSNNFSLAQMVDPVWGGCIASSTAEFRAFHEESQVALFPWSSQARGFFVPERSAPDKLDDEELARCWYSDENFQRQARCFELAKKYDTHPVCINLAYVLHQKFPIFPLIGPRLISETASTMNGLAVSLTDDEVKYLNLED
ncbi:MAG: aldo/keto reductase, partial [Lentisphaeria bacterium]|nr:aldo/keto reductase [Lentisphaeria bacterium]NQZ67615.1 aldo/keto reductase [Lentisphaeria bacterium]